MPDQPAAVRLYTDDGTARCVVADLDVARGGQAQVDRDLTVLLELVAGCGGRAFTDRSPSGGRHLYLPLAQPVGHGELRPVMYALAVLLPSLDLAPCVNLLAGCVRPPGARHKTGGWQLLDGPLETARAVAEAPNPPGVWGALLERLRPQLLAQAIPRTDPSVGMPPEAAGAIGPRQTQAGRAPAARPGGPRPLRPGVLEVARTGRYDTARYPSPSEARQGVLASAAASGWAWSDLIGELEAGRWPGLWGLYSRYRPAYRREALAADWLAALGYATAAPTSPAAPDSATAAGSTQPPTVVARPAVSIWESHVHNPDTREPTTHGASSPLSLVVTTPGSGATGLGVSADRLPTDGYQFLRAWWTAVRHAERDRYAARSGLSRRLVLRALGNAGQKTGRRHLAFGVRSLAIAAGLSRTTVANELRALRDEPDPPIILLVGGRGLSGDLYELRIPDTYLDRACTDAWRPGRIEALLPCFRVLGVPAAFVYEQLDSHPQSSWDLAVTALLSPRATQRALAELAAHHLAVRDTRGWTRGPADPAAVARALGADQLVADQSARYRVERDAWRIRLGSYPTPDLAELFRTPPLVADPDLPAAQAEWLPAQPQPPPVSRTSADRARVPAAAPVSAARSARGDGRPQEGASTADDALAIVLQVLGGTVLTHA